MKILGVYIDNFSKKQIQEKIESFLEEEKVHQIATINPEFILQAQKNVEFKEILGTCDLCIADGVGIWFAFLRFGKCLRSRVTGIDLMGKILKIANQKKLSVFLATNQKGLSSWEETRNAIWKVYPQLDVFGVNVERESFSYQMPAIDCQILFCNFGAPEQEKFIHSLKMQKNSKIRLAMGVGGSFDFLTGKIRRAPKIFRHLGLEWLWRFFQEPRYRAKRIFQAVVIFPIKVVFNSKPIN